MADNPTELQITLASSVEEWKRLAQIVEAFVPMQGKDREIKDSFLKAIRSKIPYR